MIVEVDQPERTPSLTPGDGEHFDPVLGYHHNDKRPGAETSNEDSGDAYDEDELRERRRRKR